MRCYFCDNVLEFIRNLDLAGDDLYDMITFLDCPKCNAGIKVYHPKDQQEPVSRQCSMR